MDSNGQYAGNTGENIVSVVTDYSAQNSVQQKTEETMSMSTAATGEI